jgi:hypothetical protein
MERGGGGGAPPPAALLLLQVVVVLPGDGLLELEPRGVQGLQLRRLVLLVALALTPQPLHLRLGGQRNHTARQQDAMQCKNQHQQA